MGKVVRLVVAAALAIVVLPSLSEAAGRRPPRNAFELRFGWFFPSGGGPLWDDVESQFTLDASDLDGDVFGLTYMGSVSNNFEVGFDADFFHEVELSAARDFVDQDGFAIYHDTELETTTLSIDLRFLPGGRYRSRPGGVHVLKPVWYIGATAGVNFWDYDEFGDFVDSSNPLDPFVFSDHFSEDGEAFQYGALLGVELPVQPSFHILFEGRYTWAKGDLDGDLASLDSIELGGASGFFGLAFRF